MLPPSHSSRRIRVGWIAIGVVPLRMEVKLAATGQAQGWIQYIRVLPVKVIMRHRYQVFPTTIRMLQFKSHRLTTEVHVGVHGVKNDVLAYVFGAGPGEGPVVRRYLDGWIDEDTGLQTVLDWPLGLVKP